MSTLHVNKLKAAVGTTVSVADGHTFAPPGHVIQVVQSTLTSTVSGTGTSYNDSGLSAAITPTSASSKIFINGYITVGTSSFFAYCHLCRGNTAIFHGDGRKDRLVFCCLWCCS